MLRCRLEERDPDRRPPGSELASFLAIRALQAVIHGTALDAPERLSHPLFVDEVSELFLRYFER